MEGKGSKKGIIVIGVILVVFVAISLILYAAFRARTAEGSKAITVTVVDQEGTTQVYEHRTDALYLKQALDEIEGLSIEGVEGDYGIYVQSVNGQEAIYDRDGAYWAFYVNGAYCNYAIEEQPVNDEDAFEIRYETGTK